MTPPILSLFADAGGGPPPAFHEFYAANLRTGLFSGFLTLSGFLLAMKTLVVIQLRKELYDTKFYRGRVVKQREANASLSVYGPLRHFGRLLLAAVCLSLATAVSQFTLGLWRQSWAAAVCLGLAAATVVVLAIALAVLWSNLGDLFRFWEAEANDKIRKETAEPHAA
jgi:hypothetical protein